MVIYFRSNDQPLERREGLKVEGGQTLDLGDIDLRQHFRELAIAIVDASGERVDASLTLYDARGTDLGSRALSASSPARFSVPIGTARACVSAEGCRSQMFEDLRGGAIWSLSKSYDIRLVWPESLPALAAPLRVRVYLWDGSDAPCARGSDAAFDAALVPGAEVALDTSIAGPWEVRVRVRNDDTRATEDVNYDSPQRIDVADTAEIQRFRLELDAAAFARAIASVRGQ
jgi:hypothetical protein